MKVNFSLHVPIRRPIYYKADALLCVFGLQIRVRRATKFRSIDKCTYIMRPLVANGAP